MLPSKLTVCALQDRLPLFLLRESMCFCVCVRLLSQWDLWLACAAWSCCLVWRSGESHNRVLVMWLENWLYWGSIAQQLKSTVYSAAWTLTLLTSRTSLRMGEGVLSYLFLIIVYIWIIATVKVTAFSLRSLLNFLMGRQDCRLFNMHIPTHRIKVNSWI